MYKMLLEIGMLLDCRYKIIQNFERVDRLGMVMITIAIIE
jgi:hypothetical protein